MSEGPRPIVRLMASKRASGAGVGRTRALAWASHENQVVLQEANMAAELWEIDTVHSGIHFWARHMMFSKVHGTFTRWRGKIWLDRQNLAASSVEVDIEAASIDTGEPKRDAHLRSADFLDVEHHPAMVFESTQVKHLGEERFEVVGELTIRGETRQVTLDAALLGRGKDPYGKERMGGEARTSLDRKDFGLKWNQILESGGVLVGDRLEIQLEIEAVRVQPEAGAWAPATEAQP